MNNYCGDKKCEDLTHGHYRNEPIKDFSLKDELREENDGVKTNLNYFIKSVRTQTY